MKRYLNRLLFVVMPFAVTYAIAPFGEDTIASFAAYIRGMKR